MPNPATSLPTQDERIPGLPVLPAGADVSTLTVPVYYPATDQTHQAPIGGAVPTTNAVPGGVKVVQYRDSRLYGVPATALTLDRLKPLTITPGTLAVVDNPANTPLTVTSPPQQYVATVVAAGTPGAVLVPRYLGAPVGDAVYISWQAVLAGGPSAVLTIEQPLADVQDLLNAGEEIVAGAEYALAGDWNRSGDETQVVHVHAADATSFRTNGTLVRDEFPAQEVVVDVLAGTATPLPDYDTQQQHTFELNQLFSLRDSRIVVKAPGGAVSAWTTMPTFLESGSVVTVHGAPYFPSLDYQFPASGTLVLAPGSTLTLKNLRPPSGSLLLCGEGTLNAPVNIGPAAQQVTIRDIQLNGYLYAFSYNIFGATRKLRLYNVRLTNTDASQAAAVTVDYGYAQNYYTYLQAEIIGCDITSAGDAIKFFDQFPGAAAGDAQAKATNSLLLLQNRIKVGSGRRVLNDDAGALSFVRGGNLYVAASVPAQAYAVVVGTDGGTGSGQPAPSAGPALGTGTILTFKVDTEYPELFSGTYTVDATGAQLGVVVRARLGANAAPPLLPNTFVLLAGAYASGARHLYSFSVAPGGVIEYYITRLP
jgi:hypothetical protein